MSDMPSHGANHPCEVPSEQLLRHCEVRRVRRSGPGGQHRNKVETGIVLKHVDSGIAAEANERRSQAQNLQQALRRLRMNLALGVRVARSSATCPSELWQSRCRNRRIAVNPEHDDFPALLAEALDVLETADWDLAGASTTLLVSKSQLMKFLQLEPRAWKRLNDERSSRGLRVLKQGP